jgi:hypothetical protein
MSSCAPSGKCVFESEERWRKRTTTRHCHHVSCKQAARPRRASTVTFKLRPTVQGDGVSALEIWKAWLRTVPHLLQQRSFMNRTQSILITQTDRLRRRSQTSPSRYGNIPHLPAPWWSCTFSRGLFLHLGLSCNSMTIMRFRFGGRT